MRQPKVARMRGIHELLGVHAVAASVIEPPFSMIPVEPFPGHANVGGSHLAFAVCELLYESRAGCSPSAIISSPRRTRSSEERSAADRSGARKPTRLTARGSSNAVTLSRPRVLTVNEARACGFRSIAW